MDEAKGLNPSFEGNFDEETADLRELRLALVRERDAAIHQAAEWRKNFGVLQRALVGETGASGIEVAHALRKDAERYRWLAARLLAADFDYNGEGVQALVFEMPDGFHASADCGATIDAAMRMAPAVGAA